MSETTSRKTRRILIWIYGAALLYFVLKQLYYAVYVGGFPDQRVHLSYIVEMCRNPSLLPDFANLPVWYGTGWDGLTLYLYKLDDAVNYLGHPSLYYLIVALTGPVRFLEDGGATLDYLRVSLVSIAMTSCGAVLTFRMGYKYLKSRSPFVHALFAAAVATLPELGYVGGGASNDNLAFLAFAVFFTGVMRYHQEDKPDLKTYLLIGIGFLLGSFSKMTMAMIMLIMLIVILIMSIVRTKSLKLIANRWFLMTLPCYLLFLAYEIVIYRRYGGFQPSLAAIAPEFYKTSVFYVAPENRVPMTLLQYLARFASGIGHSWSSIYNDPGSEFSLRMHNGVFGIVYWIPVGVSLAAAAVQLIRRKADRYTIPAAAGFLGTMAYHIVSGWSGFLKSGYAGGAQARYYLPLIIPFAFIMCETLPPLFRTEKAKKAGAALAVILILCLIAGDVPRVLLYTGFSEY